MNTERNKLDHSVIPLFVLAVVTFAVLGLTLVPARTGATASLAVSSQQGPEMVTVRQSGSTGEDVPLAGSGEWAQASVEISGAPDDAVISHVQVKYSVVYSQPSDLEVQLLNSGAEVTHTLWNRESAEGPDLTRSAGEINAFQGAPVNGTWSLAVKGGEQEGYIDGFSINVYYETDMPVLRQEGGTPGQPGFLRLPEGVTPASLPHDEDEKPDAEEGSSIIALDVPPGATVIETEDFEGSFYPPSTPPGWTVWDASNDGYERLWDDVSCDECGGDWAAWPADRGVDRVDVCAGDDYPDDMHAWMRYGPFDLSDAQEAGTEFVMWRNIEVGYDWVFFGVSADGSNFTGIFWDGTADCTSHNVTYPGWVGDSSVWVAWVFYSDYIVNYEGPFVDDIVIWKRDVPPTCDIRMEPTSKTVSQGSSFTFDVWIDNVVDLGGFQFDLDYDPNLVNVDVSSYGGADPGPFPGSTGRSVFETGPTVNNTTGDMTYGVYTTGAASGASGSGTVATVYFTAENPGTSTLDLSNVQVTDTTGSVIPCNPPQDGIVEVTSAPAMRINPAALEVTAGEIFSVTVEIDNVTNLAHFQFDLKYAADVVQPGTDPVSDCARLGPFLGSTGRNVYDIGPFVSAGLIEYAAWSSGSADGPSGSGTLATIILKAGNSGTTPLGLREVIITDPVGTELDVNVQDGEVTVTSGGAVYLPIILKNY